MALTQRHQPSDHGDTHLSMTYWQALPVPESSKKDTFSISFLVFNKFINIGMSSARMEY
jgi:hypothetical protein